MHKKRVVARKALIKLLGKEVRYTATFHKRSADSCSVMFIDIKHNGKLVADHVWVGAGRELTHCEIGDNLTFLGTANSYKDTHGIRKYGLEKCYRYHFGENTMDEVKNDNVQKYIRKKK